MAEAVEEAAGFGEMVPFDLNRGLPTEALGKGLRDRLGLLPLQRYFGRANSLPVSVRSLRRQSVSIHRDHDSCREDLFRLRNVRENGP